MKVINPPVPLRKMFLETYKEISAYILSDNFQRDADKFLSTEIDIASFLDETGFPDFPLGN